jgi:hypothetical protein
MSNRQQIGKRLRFAVFARDGFTCRYCGRQSDQVTLHVDHVIPVCQGGTNDEANLVTACVDCNLGKSGNSIEQSAPNETDRLRMAQELREQAAAAERAKALMSLREGRKQELVNFWCDQCGATSMERRTLATIFSYVERYGEEIVYPWIEKAAAVCRGNPLQMGQYVSGIRRAFVAELESEEQHDA